MFKLVAVSLISSALTAAHAPSAANDQRATFTSLGPARIGMSRQQLERALGARLKSGNPDADSDSCEYTTPEVGDAGVSYMLINRHLARIDISEPNIFTLSGAHVGSSKDSVLGLYGGRVVVSPHAYTAPEGEYLTMLSPDSKNGIRFETDQGKVTVYYLGTAEAIQYIEGCL